ncbi:MAG TPA: gephyrin-like molybdotransferase Glp [Gemmatimonas sp.]|nr:gephyrin-like molybdotransferase Glp [Gemmatimonas sp.]
MSADHGPGADRAGVAKDAERGTSPGGDRLAYDEALAAVLRDVPALQGEVVALTDAFGRALAAPVVSPVALPPWDNSGMDGYAVRREDIVGASPDAPVRLRVCGMIAAGADPLALPTVLPGCAHRIMTGAPVPPGSDAVIGIEDTDRGTTSVTIHSGRDTAGRGNIRPRGEDVAAGETLFERGTTLGASHLGVLSSVGSAQVRVHRRPRVVLLSGGDELVMLDRFDEAQAGRRIVSSSSYALPAYLRELGADVTVRPLVPDTLASMTDALLAALDSEPDLLITTGGVSVGDHDYTRDALQQLGGNIEFWRARIRPGGPIGRGTLRGTHWLGLPGNPVSTMVTALLFAAPLVRQLGGHARVHHLLLRARMLDIAATPSALAHFLRVSLRTGADGMLEAKLAGAQGSNLLRTMASADALLVVPEHAIVTEAGAIYEVLLLPGALWQTISTPTE